MPFAGLASARRAFWIKVALFQGITSPILYAVKPIVGAALRPGYSRLAQAVSELTQAGAVNKPGWP